MKKAIVSIWFALLSKCLLAQEVFNCYRLFRKVPPDITRGYFVDNTLKLYDDSTFILSYKTYKTKGSKKRKYVDFFSEYKGVFRVGSDTVYLLDNESHRNFYFLILKNGITDFSSFKDIIKSLSILSFCSSKYFLDLFGGYRFCNVLCNTFNTFCTFDIFYKIRRSENK
jgi:hypothetical protein